MCQLKRETKRKLITGYKYALKKDGKFYSPATGVEYKPGYVTEVTMDNYETLDYSFIIPSEYLSKSGTLFSPYLVGRTAVFQRKTDCIENFYDYNAINKKYFIDRNVKDGYKPVMIKMTLSNSIYEGEYNNYKVFAGKNIIDLKEVEIR